MKLPEFTGVTIEDEKMSCSVCGTEIDESMMHFYSCERTEEYSINSFKCKVCGNILSVKFFEEEGKADEKVCN